MTPAAVAAAISVVLGSIGGSAVIAAMGFAALSVIASGTVGGTVRYKLQRLHVPPSTYMHRYVWSFTASTGDYYGEYISPL